MRNCAIVGQFISEAIWSSVLIYLPLAISLPLSLTLPTYLSLSLSEAGAFVVTNALNWLWFNACHKDRLLWRSFATAEEAGEAEEGAAAAAAPWDARALYVESPAPAR